MQVMYLVGVQNHTTEVGFRSVVAGCAFQQYSINYKHLPRPGFSGAFIVYNGMSHLKLPGPGR